MINKIRNLQEVTCLCVHRAYEFLDECGCIVGFGLIVREVRPCRVNSELLVFVAAVNGSEVLVYDILPLLAVALDDDLRQGRVG